MTVKPKIDLTPKVALDLLKEAVDERGKKYIYPPSQKQFGKESNCLYASKGKPSCLVGVVLHKAGISIAALRRFDAHQEAGVPTELVEVGLIELPDITAEILTRAQSVQDTGGTWGEALKEAREYAKVAKANAK